ncbi:hypothetical protein BU16DRAFT_604157 [Lophium mytilinum]|uniref:RING-type domain-containing protein n=1 Tax=Lophium mytilinum TaxID=390894 RepID=A0A6A6R3Z9_9PEZI|nr:hypothetical protein BU16DRAFT_604157 [Lophium mytilinum]
MSSTIPLNSTEFIANRLTNIDATSNVEVPDKCPICHEDFNASHPAVQITNIPDCTHIFGRGCLMSWLSSGRNNQNTCPMCRQRLYRESGDHLVPRIPIHRQSLRNILVGWSTPADTIDRLLPNREEHDGQGTEALSDDAEFAGVIRHLVSNNGEREGGFEALLRGFDEAMAQAAGRAVRARQAGQEHYEEDDE